MMTLQSLIPLTIIIIVFLIGKKSIRLLVQRIGRERSIASNRIQYVNAVLLFFWSVMAFIAVGIFAGIGYKDLGVFFGSIFAVIGVALFAQWSILSNVTASIIVFFFFPYRVGDNVKILDGENSVEGVINEISLFHVILMDVDGLTITYPNALVFQKAVKIQSQPEKNSAR